MKLVQFFLLPFLLACSAYAADTPPPKVKLRVGVIAPLTGPAAEYGVAIRNAITLQQKEHPGDETVEFLFEDAAYNARASVDSFSRLRTVEHVDAIYVWGVVFCEAIAPLAEQFNLPMIAQCVQPNVTKGRKQVVRFANPADDYTAKLWEHARRKGIHKIGMVLAENAYLQLMADALQRQKHPDEEILIVDRYQPGQNDFRSTLVKLRSNPPDAVAVFLGPGQIGPFYRQLAEQQIHLPSYGTNLFESTSELATSAQAIEGAVIANNSAIPDFQRRYQEAYGNQSQIAFAAYAYDFANLVQDFASRYTGNPGTLLAELTKSPPEKGVCGEIRPTTDAGGGLSYSFPVVLKEIHAGSFSEIQ